MSGNYGEDTDYADVLNPQTNVPDTGAGSSFFSLDYYRNKVVEFQTVLNALDATYATLWETGAAAYASGDSELIAEYENLVSAFESKRSTFQNVVYAIQTASGGINSLGVSFPSVQMPYGLAAIPAVPLAAAAAAIAAAVALITWAQQFFATVRDYAQRAQHLQAIEMLPDAEKAGALESFRNAEFAARKAEAETSESPLKSLATIGKWAAIGGIAFLAYRMYQSNLKGR